MSERPDSSARIPNDSARMPPAAANGALTRRPGGSPCCAEGGVEVGGARERDAGQRLAVEGLGHVERSDEPDGVHDSPM
jgi:hypothetical protein